MSPSRRATCSPSIKARRAAAPDAGLRSEHYRDSEPATFVRRCSYQQQRPQQRPRTKPSRSDGFTFAGPAINADRAHGARETVTGLLVLDLNKDM